MSEPTDMLADAMAWLDGQRRSMLARSVVYERGTSSVELPATVGRTTYEQTDEAGATVETNVRDFLITASDLVLDGVPIVPAIGDRVYLETAEGVEVCEVLDLGGTGHYAPALGGQCWRVHTRRVQVVTS